MPEKRGKRGSTGSAMSVEHTADLSGSGTHALSLPMITVNVPRLVCRWQQDQTEEEEPNDHWDGGAN